MPASPHRLRPVPAGGLTLAVVVSMTSFATQAASTPVVDTAELVSSAGEPTASTLTLITGDTVAVTTQADGKQAVSVVAASGTSQHFQFGTGEDGDLYVYPEDALTAVAAGTVDRELFNVTQLLEDGYGDATSVSLPTIVDFQGSPSAADLTQRSDALPASASDVVMPRLSLAAVDVDKTDAEQFWQVVKPTVKQSRAGTAVATGSAGVAKLWYDGMAHVTLDQSVPQIGAPEAWAAGYDGKGVKVAVLDTGVDVNHADIGSGVVASQSFIAGQTVQDGHGHGTHVASTIVGSGANSGGKYKGVAPGADLLVGKVLANTGLGHESSILAGMEWAVAAGGRHRQHEPRNPPPTSRAPTSSPTPSTRSVPRPAPCSSSPPATPAPTRRPSGPQATPTRRSPSAP